MSHSSKKEPAEAKATNDKAVPPNIGYEEVVFTAAAVPSSSVEAGPTHAYEEARFEDKENGTQVCALDANIAYDVHTPETTLSSVPGPTVVHPPSLREEELVLSEGDYQYPDVVKRKGTNVVRPTFSSMISSVKAGGVNWGFILGLISIVVAVASLVISLSALGISTAARSTSTQVPGNCTTDVLATCVLEDSCETSSVSTQVGVSSVLGCTVSSPLALEVNVSFSAALLNVNTQGFSCQCHTSTELDVLVGDAVRCNLIAVRCL